MTRLVSVLFVGVIFFLTAFGHEGNFDLQVFYKPNLIAIINDSTMMGKILDYSSGLMVILNGKRNTIIVVDIYKQMRYYLDKTDPEIGIWCDFQDYFQTLSSLQHLLKIGQEKGNHSTLDTIEEPVRGYLTEMFHGLDGSSPVLGDVSQSTKFIEQLKGSLSLVYGGSGSFRISCGLQKFTRNNLAVAELLNYLEGKLTPENVNLNATQIFEAESGAEVLLKVMSQTGEKFNLTEVFRGLFSSRETVLSLLKNASSGSHNGLDGLLMILLNYAELFYEKGSTNKLINSVLNYNSGAADGQSLSSLVNQTFTLVANQDKVFHNAAGFSGFVSILNVISDNNYTSNNINISDIITLLTSRNSTIPLSSFVNVLSSFYQTLNISDSFGSIKRQFHQTLDGGSTPGNSDHQVIYKPFLIAVVNKSAKMAMVIDYFSQLIAELNGKQAYIQVVDISKNVRYSLKNDTDMENIIWTNFEDHFQKQTSLRQLLKICQEKGEKSSTYTLEEPVRGVLKEVYNNLRVSSPLPEVLSLVTKFMEKLKGRISLVYRGSGSFRISGGVEEFIKENLAATELLSYSKGISDRHVFYKPSIIGFVNKSTRMGMILDYSSRLIGYFNVKQGNIILIDISKQARYYLKKEADMENSIWSNVEDNFQKLSSLQPLLKICQEKGEKSELITQVEHVQGTWEEICNSLGGSSSMPESLSLLTKFIDSLNSTLSLLYKASGSFEIANGLNQFTKENLVVAEMLNYSKEKLSAENVDLNVTQIFKAKCGTEVLLKVLSQVGVHYNLIEEFGILFKNRENALSLLENASSGSHDGLDGLLMILVKYAELSDGKGSTDQLISSVMNYNSRPGDGQSLNSLVNQTLTLVSNQDKVFHNAAGFSGFVSILNVINDNNYTSNNINMSNIITLLTKRRSRNPLDTFVTVLSSFYQALEIPNSFGSIIKQFNQTMDGGPTTGNSEVQVICKPSLIALVNKTEKMAVVLDYSSQLLAAFNGKQGYVQVVDISKNVRYSLKNNADMENIIWTNFEYYVQKQFSSKLLLKICQEKGEKPSTYTSKELVRGVLKEVFNSLGVSSPLPEVHSLLIELMEKLKGSLSLVYRRSGSFKIFGGVEKFIKENLAVTDLLNYSKGISDRHVFYKPSIICFVNKSARMGMILDYSSRLIGYFDVKQGNIILIDISKQARYYLKKEADIENSIWSNVEDNFQKLSSLQPLLEICQEKGEKSELDTPVEHVQGTWEEISKSLGGSSSMQESLPVLTKFIDSLNSTLSLLYKGSGSFGIANGLDRFTKMNLAIAKMLNCSKEKLSSDNVDLNPTQIFKAECGTEVLLKLLSQVGVHYNLIEEFGILFKNRENALSLLENASSGSHDGLDGLLMILVKYAELSDRKGSTDQLISSVMNYNSRPGDEQSLNSLVNQTLTLVANQDKLFHNAAGFSGFVSILNVINDNNHTSNNINMSNIITLLTERRSRNPLDTFVTVLSSFYQALEIPNSFGSIIKQFNQTMDGGSTPGNSEVQLICKPSLIALANKTKKMAVVLDYSSQLLAAFNGKQGYVQVVDISKNVSYSLKNNADMENIIWTNFEYYVQKQFSSKLLLKICQEKGEKPSTYTSKELVRGILKEVFNSLGVSSPLPEVHSLLIEFMEKLKGSLSLVYRRSGSFKIFSGVEKFIKENLAVTELLNYSKGISDHHVFYKPSIIGFVNKSARMGMILDYSCRLIGYFNVKQGNIILIDISKQVKYYLKKEADIENSIWSNVEVNFQKLSSLQPLLNICQEKGEKSELDTTVEHVQGSLEEICNSLGGSSSMPESLSFLTKFIDSLNSTLSLLYKGSGSFGIANGLNQFTKENLVVAEMLNYSKEKLSAENVDLNATQIFKAKCCTEVLLKVLSQVGVRYNLIEEFDILFKNRENVLSLLENASSGSHDGIDGLLMILVSYAKLSDGKGSTNQLISSVLDYNSRFGDGQSLSSLVNQTLTLVGNQDMVFHNAAEFSAFVSILNVNNDNNNTSNNINISEIISLLSPRRSRNPLGTLVNVLSPFYQALKIPNSFGSIIKQFNETMDSGSTPGISDHQVIYKPSLIGMVNKSANMAVIFDYFSQIIAVFNGKQSTVQVLDVSRSVIYSLAIGAEMEKSIWSNFEYFFQKKSSLQHLLKICRKKGKRSSINTLEESVRRDLEEVFKSLGASSSSTEVISLFIKFMEQLKSQFSMVYKGSGSFSITAGLEVFIKANLAVVETLRSSDKGGAGGGGTEAGGEKECESGQKGGFGIHLGLFNGGKRPIHMGIGGGHGNGNKKGNCGRPLGVSWQIFGGRGKGRPGKGRGKKVSHTGGEGGYGSKTIDGGGGNEGGNWGERRGAAEGKGRESYHAGEDGDRERNRSRG